MRRNRGVFAFVELSPDLSDHLLADVLFHAYRLARHTPVVVWRSGHSLEEIEEALQPAVDKLGTRYAGVEYFDTDEAEVAAARSRMAEICVLTTNRLKALIDPAVRQVSVTDLAAIAAV